MSERMLIVRCVDRSTFEVDRETLEPKSCSVYDAHCYNDPLPTVDYIEHAEWCIQRNEMRKKWYA